jgi:hypothetical protein
MARRRRTRERQRHRRRRLRWLAAAAALLAAGLLATAMLSLGSGGEETRQDPAVERLLPDYAARAGGVVVARPVVDFGHVPLDVTVEHTFTLHNAGPERVHLGHVTVAVLEGC